VIDEMPVFSFRGDQHLSHEEWSLSLFGSVEVDTTLDWEGFEALPHETRIEDFHCVTGWSRLGDEWYGVASVIMAELCRPAGSVVSVMVHCADGYTTNVPIDDFLAEGVMLVTHMNGDPLEPEHGFPVRLIVPHLYAYKAAKWVVGLEFMEIDEPGFWESQGYHHRGDPWGEERYSGD
jgi:DMSO/TMAO reductase YedYZ molybdopterin-dependent catalytic subunit